VKRTRLVFTLCTFALCAFALLTLSAAPLTAQVSPDAHWRTLTTTHFRVHFSTGLDSLARRTAGSAERAYAGLANELHEPRGTIDIVLGDNVDYSNGYATVFPTNRITLYARPPVDAIALKYIDDWIDLVVTHELTHIFHLDRTRGWWALGQYVFGRNPFLFPNLYTPNWLDEGIAVYYESRLTGAGRVNGTEHSAIARAKALDKMTPAINALSASVPEYPLGETVYAYGSLLVDYIARTQGPATMRTFIETSAARTIPYLLNANAKAGFGIGFDSAYKHWSDSIRAGALAFRTTTTQPRDIVKRGWYAEKLRWVDDDHLIFARNDGRAIASLSEMDVRTGETRALERRNSLDATTQLANGARVWAEQDFIDPYSVRSRLYFSRDGKTTNVLPNRRLLQSNARMADGVCASADCIDIVAVELQPGTTGLARIVTREGVAAGEGERGVQYAAITTFSPDTTWSDPRWSHRNARIAAVRSVYGATSEVVILDTLGRVQNVLGRARGVTQAPSWSPNDDYVYFTSDRSGRPAIYRATVESGALVKIAENATSLTESEVSPNGKRLATLDLRGDGFRIATVDVPSTSNVGDTLSVLPLSNRRPVVSLDSIAAPVSPYSSWRGLVPRYWLPALEQSDEGRTMYGFLTSASDVIGRHAYALQGTLEPKRSEPNLNFSYQYAGLGNPVLGVTGVEQWDHFGLFDAKKVRVGTLARRKMIGDLAVTFLRPRVRSNTYLTLGVEQEWRDFRTDPSDVLSKIDTTLQRTYTYPALLANVGFNNARQPTLAISPEDGVQLSATARQRWRSDTPEATRSTSVIAVASAFKSLDFPGFAHHVLAVRAAYGWADSKTASDFTAGGVSGSTLQIAPGVILGDGHRTFFVRGFPGGAQSGSQAVAGSAEYRLPVALPSAGYKFLPLFLQRVSAAAFVDAASAWCPGTYASTSAVCPVKGTAQQTMASAGAELQLNAALQYDVPFLFRFGAATPIAGRTYFGSSNVAAYFTVGLAF
jgi:hypothetical protein